MDLLKTLRPMHDMGFALIHLLPKSKRPIGTAWTEGPRMSWAQFEKDFKPNFNTGVRLGSPSKFSDDTYLCVLDCDVKSSDPKHLKEMEEALYLLCPSVDFAPRVLSGRGGGSCHVYLRTPAPQQSFKAVSSRARVKVLMPSVAPSQADEKELSKAEIKDGYRMRLAWEIDVFGEGKQVVVPPSVHPDTNACYAWDGEAVRDFKAIPRVKNFEAKKRTTSKSASKFTGKFVEVDLFDNSMIDSAAFDLIVGGIGIEKFPSRSEALFSCLNALVLAGHSDDEILSVLTDPENFMSEKALEKGSREDGARWLAGQLSKVRRDYSKTDAFLSEAVVEDMDELFALSDEEVALQESEVLAKHWTDELEVTNKGFYKNTAFNVYLILKNLYKENDNAKPPVLVKRDLFADHIIYATAPPWGDKSDIGRQVKDTDECAIRIWFSREWGLEVGEQNIFSTINKIAEDNGFHPVRDYLGSLKWDGVKRVGKLFKHYCNGVDDDKYLEFVARKMMCAAVARIFVPGIKFDHVVVMTGGQGKGKSAFCEILGSSEWYLEGIGNVSNKDVVDNIAGKWIIEMGEMVAARKSDIEEFKAFITRTVDKVRKAYGRRAVEYPRSCIFIATTNEDEFFKDETGNRRFWPVEVGQIEFDDLKRDRDQLWAEAVHIYKAGEKLWIDDPAMKAVIEKYQEARMVSDALSELIEKVLESLGRPERFTSYEILIHPTIATYIKNPLADKGFQMRLGKCLMGLGYRRVKVRDDEGFQKRGWRIRPK